MKTLKILTLTLGLAWSFAPISALADLAVGDPAPDFELMGSDGVNYKLSEMKGQTVVVAWFPKAFTGG